MLILEIIITVKLINFCIVMPNTVIKIDDYAFSSCLSLKTIKLSNSLKEIGNKAFGWCPLESITIPNLAISFADTTFRNCKSLKLKINIFFELILNYQLIKMSCWPAHKKYYDITDISFKDTVTKIDADTFMYWGSLKNVKLPSKLEDIPPTLFCNCYSLETVKIPRLVKSIGSHAFYASGLKTLVIPFSVNQIHNAFVTCRKLKSIIIPNSVYFMDNTGFYECDKLKCIARPKKLNNFYTCNIIVIVY